MRARYAAGIITAVTLLALTGCEPETPIEVTGLNMQLGPCLGAIEDVAGPRDGSLDPVASTCRASLDRSVDTASLVNACLIVRPRGESDDPNTRRLPFHWETGRLTNAFPGRNIELPPGTLEASLFFVAEGDETGAVCDGLFVEDACGDDQNCVLKLFDPNVDATRDGGVFDFTDDTGACNAENGPAFEMGMGAVELCDGMDNDCDRAIDEDIATAGDPCTEGTGACEVAGQLQCRPDRGMVCVQGAGSMAPDVVPGEPTPEACDDADERCCDGIDQDCDGDTDEFLECTPCTVDDDCAPDTDNPDGNPGGPLCVMQEVGGTVVGRCDACQPVGVIADDPDSDHRGCGPNELCCTTLSTARASAFACQPTAFGLEAGSQCTGCGVGCGLEVNGETVLNANGCVDRECRCGFGPACTDPARPYCHLEECVQCRDNDDCGPEELCCDGACVPTDPLTRCATCETGCDTENANRCVGRECRCGTATACGGDLRECRRGDRPQDAICVECEADFNCEGEVGRPACFEQRCRPCRDDSDDFCAQNEVAAMEGRLQCVGLECFECDTADHAGCEETGEAPICGADNTCRACTVDADDPANAAGDDECRPRPGARDECVGGTCHICDPEGYSGCDDDPSEPVCQRDDEGGHTCRGCRNDAECDVLERDGVDKVCAANGQCQGCEVGNNDGCDPFGTTPICRELNGNPVCRRCENDDECPSFLGDGMPPMPEGGRAPVDELVFCVSGGCRECDPERAPSGCNDPGEPICANGDCVPCEADADCELIVGNDDAFQCIRGGGADGQCKVCDPADNAGCDPEGTTPICDPATFTCVPCGDNAECNRPGELADPPAHLNAAPDPPVFCVEVEGAGRCVECEPDTNNGCNPLGDLPICEGERPDGEGGVIPPGCRPCNASDECVALDIDRLGCFQGRCTECDVDTHEPCDATEVCLQGTCRPCAADEECARRGDGRSQCVAGECHECDPADFAGCNPLSAEPACGGDNTCRGCDDDGECRAEGGHPASPTGPFCNADGVCRECDPRDPSGVNGCDPTGNAPFCAPDGNCESCGLAVPTGDDRNCPDGQQCVRDRCAECDPQTFEGCLEIGAEPICDAARLVCRGCGTEGGIDGDDECRRRPGNRNQCVDTECVVCDPADDAGCNDPSLPVCRVQGGQPTCTACQRDDECPGSLLCARGQCVECDSADNRGCNVAGLEPFCGADSECRSCRLIDGADPATDAECVSDALPQCVGGRCRECDPLTHDGCDEDGPNPFCDAAGTCRPCANGGGADFHRECDDRPGNLDYCLAGRCVECDSRAGQDSAGCGGATPFCDTQDVDGDQIAVCRPCQLSTECPDGQQCVGGTCRGCSPGSNDGCQLDSSAPFCDRDELFCRGCGVDAECRANGGLDPAQQNNPNGDQCYLGQCVECDPTGGNPAQIGCTLNTNRPICDEGTCVACEQDFQCSTIQGNGGRNQCVSSVCEVCDPTDNAGCVASSNTPDCRGAAGSRSCQACRPAQEASDCQNNPNGAQCVGGACVQCDPANNDGCDADGTAPVCDNGTRTCRGCTDDGECPGGQQCFAGACEECDPITHDGCDPTGAEPICDAVDKTCRACANGSQQCRTRPNNQDRNICVDGDCVVCDTDTHAGCFGTTPICDDGEACEACTRNLGGILGDNCPEGQCLADGSCSGCNPTTNAGCEEAVGPCDPNQPDGAQCQASICDVEERECRACTEADCGGQRPLCVAGRCEECNPIDHTGCGQNELCCEREGVLTCVPTDPASECTACGEACTDGAYSACEARSCVCGPADECADPQPFCVDRNGQPDPLCSECVDSADCDGDSTAPICGLDECRGCANNGECLALGGAVDGPICVTAGGQRGGCRACDPADNDGCEADSDAPICDAATQTCRGCGDDGECTDPDLGKCTDGGSCQECDPNDRDTGCDDPDRPVCLPGTFTCGCAVDADCEGTRQCVGGICAECDPTDGQGNAGCDPGSNRPYCADNRMCVGCNGQANGCTENPNGQICSGNRCFECVPAEHRGCDADELCCDNTCQDAVLGECEACGDACNPGGGEPPVADQCVDRGCACGEDDACAAPDICDGGACVECRFGDAAGDGDCFARFAEDMPECIDGGTCAACDPDDFAGTCDDEIASRCDALLGCVCGATGMPCDDAEFCVDTNDDGEGDTCAACDPADNAGCDTAANPICDPIGRTCRPCDAVDGDAECTNHPDPTVGNFCHNGRCRACRPVTHEGCANDQLCCNDGGAPYACVSNNEADGAEVRCRDCFDNTGCTEPDVCVDRDCVVPEP